MAEDISAIISRKAVKQYLIAVSRMGWGLQ